jgi:hypothetical protein
LEMVSFRIEKNYILLYSEQSPTKIHAWMEAKKRWFCMHNNSRIHESSCMFSE